MLNEIAHDSRIIPLAGRPRPDIDSWTGESRGRWEGDTLVVETTHFTDKHGYRGSTKDHHLIEGSRRSTRTRCSTSSRSAIIEREGDGYVALCSEVAVVSQRDTTADARANLEAALTLFVETPSTEETQDRLRDDGERHRSYAVMQKAPAQNTIARLTSLQSIGPVDDRVFNIIPELIHDVYHNFL